MRSGSGPLIWLSLILGMGVIYAAIYAPLAAFWAELFETRVRYSGIGSVYQFSGIYASGLTPLIGAALIQATGGEPWAFAGYMVVVALLGLAVLAFMPETNRKDIYPTGADTTAATEREVPREPKGGIASQPLSG